MSNDYKPTPLMKQYFSIRDQYPDVILLFQVGDFYELFFDDAIKASRFLGIALTKRGKHKGEDIPLCGVPLHAIKHYITKLVRGGFKVALCDQLSQPKPGTVVDRGVTQVFTPGTLTDESMLDTKAASYLLSLYPYEDKLGLVFGELLTAQLFATSLSADGYRNLESELCRFFPDEIVVPDIKESISITSHLKKQGFQVSVMPSYEQHDEVGNPVASMWLEKQFNPHTLAILQQQPSLSHTMQLMYYYLHRSQSSSLSQFTSVNFYEPNDYLFLDSATQRNLEIIKNNQDGGRNNTLFAVVDHAQTAMGSRTVRKWLTRPLLQEKAIVQRQNVVAFLSSNVPLMQQLQEVLCSISDLERIVGRIALKRALVNDYLSLKDSLRSIPDIRALLEQMMSCDLARALYEKFFDYAALVDLLEQSIEDNASVHTIKRGFDDELDRLRDLVENAQRAILSLEEKEIKRSGIDSLKIRYNKVTGYAIEVTKPNVSKVPDDYIRQQTLTNRERFATQELLDLEREITRAQNEIQGVEAAVFDSVKKSVEEQLLYLRKTAYALSYLDALYSFAHCAYENNYCIPTFNDKRDVVIQGGRHPVVEQKLEGQFVSNYSSLTDTESLWIITGPNMGGKSTYLRQVAHICLLAQCGALVPAAFASVPIIDRIFTRIGAGDNVAEGKSTFLVEMEETAVICSQATKNSLVILDEVGRGTSTFDGLAIAHAVIEYIHSAIGARCLFATHYHELTKLPDEHAGITNYHMVCKKTDGGIAFVHRIEPGTSQGSFGIDVARLAQLPPQIVTRARNLLHELEVASSNHHGSSFDPALIDTSALHDTVRDLQKALAHKEELFEQLRSINLDELSPRGAFDLLWNLKSKL